MPNALFSTAINLLADKLNPRSLEAGLNEGLKALGTNADKVTFRELERILKSIIFKRMQVSMSPKAAKDAVTSVLQELATLEAKTSRVAEAGEAPAGRPGSKTRDESVKASQPSAPGPGTAPGPPPRETPVPGPAGAPAAAVERQAQAVKELEDAQREFALYFEWPETQKLRSQVAVIKQEHGQGHLVPKVIEEARAQLRVVAQKVQDMLVLQAKAVAELKEDLERVRSLGGPKVKRLETLISTIEQAQEQRNLATSEVDRARHIASELRKQIESSMMISVEDDSPAPAGHAAPAERPRAEIDPKMSLAEGDVVVELDEAPAAQQPSDEAILDVDALAPEEEAAQLPRASPETAEQLKRIELADQQRDLDSLQREYRALFLNDPASTDLHGRFEELLERHRAGEVVGAELAEHKASLDDRRAQLVEEHRRGLVEYESQLNAYQEAGLDTNELRVYIQIARGTLEGNTPALDEMKRVADVADGLQRELSETRSQQAEEQVRRGVELEEQRAAHGSLSGLMGRFQVLPEELRSGHGAGLAALAAANSAGEVRPDLVERLRAESDQLLQAAEALEREQAAAQDRALQTKLDRQAEGLRMLRTILENLRGVGPAQRGAMDSLVARYNELQSAQGAREARPDLLKQLLGEADAALQAHLAQQRNALEELARSAARQGVEGQIKPLLEHARAELHAGRTIESAKLEQAARNAVAELVGAQHRELGELEDEFKSVWTLSSPQVSELRELIAAARAALSAGETTTAIADGWTLLEVLRNQKEEATVGFTGRLERISSEFQRVRAIGGENVAKLTSLLTVLEAQRESIGSISDDVRQELEKMLAECERLLGEVTREYAAAREVVSELAGSETIEDLLGVFSEQEAPAPPPAAPPPPPAPARLDRPIERRSKSKGLNDLIDSYLEQKEIEDVAVLGNDGNVLAGRFSREPKRLLQSLGDLRRYASELGEEMRRTSAVLYTVEFADSALIVASPTEKQVLVVVVSSSITFSRILGQVRRDLTGFREELAALRVA
jgi:hypothetical protein